MQRFSFLNAVSLVMFCLGSAPAQPNDWKSRVDEVFSEFDTSDQPGGAFAVLRDGKVAYSRGFGSANLEYGVKNSSSTIFHVASVSKQFTCFAIQLLAEDGKLGLDDDVRKHLPWVPDFGEAITLRQLMHHTSGLRDQWELFVIGGGRFDDVITMRHLRKLISKQRELNFPPGSDSLYSNSGYTLLAEIVAAVSEVSFKRFTQERIFEPLGMKHSHFHDDHGHIVPNRAYSYHPVRDGFRKAVLSYANVGATSLFTTADDLALWLVNLATGSVGGEGVRSRMLERGKLRNGKELPYASGLIHGEHDSLPIISHGGADAGFRSHVAYLPEKNLGVVVLANRSDVSTSRLARRVIDVMLEKAVPPPQEEKDEPDPGAVEKKRVPLDTSTLDAYVGTFLLSSGYVLRVYRDGAKLFRRHKPKPIELVPDSEREFVEIGSGYRLIFDDARDGRVMSLTVLAKEKKYRGERLDDDAAKVQGKFAGRYYCPELDTSYVIVEEDGRLVARHIRHSDIALFPLSPTHFRGRSSFFYDIKFEVNENGEATGFRLSSRRVRNLLFTRKSTIRRF